MAYVSVPYNAGGIWGPPVATSADLPSGVTTGSARVVIADDAIYMYDGTAWRNTGSAGAGVMSINTTADGPNVTIGGTPSQTTVTTMGDVISISLTDDVEIVDTLTVGTDVILTNPGTDTGTALIRTAAGVVAELTSSITFKENVRDITEEHNVHKIINHLIGRKYNYKSSESKEDTFGFIAEEVEGVCKELVIYRDGKPHSLNYNGFIPIIVEYIKTIRDDHSRMVKDISESRIILNKIITDNKELQDRLIKETQVKVTEIAKPVSEIRSSYLPYVLSAVAIALSVLIACVK